MAVATSNKATYQAMKSKLEKMAGGRGSVFIGEPLSKVASGNIAIVPERGSVDAATLQSPRDVHIVTLRRYENPFQQPNDELEFKLDQWRAQVEQDYFGDFELGGTMAYAEATQFAWEYGYITVDQNVRFRVLDITFAFRTDDRATFVA